MKKLGAILLVCLSAAAVVFAGSQPRLDLRDMALANASSADSSYVYSSYTNPAMLYFVDKLYGNVSLRSEMSSNNGSIASPLLGLDGMLILKGLLIGLDVGTQTAPGLNGDIISTRTTTLSVGLGAGVGGFSAGFLITGGSDRQNIIGASEASNFFTLMNGILFSRYDPVSGSEFLNTKLGLAYSGQWAAVSVYSDNIFNYRASDPTQTTTFGETLKRIGVNSSFALTLRTPEYDYDDLLNLFRGMLFFEAYHPFDDETREYKVAGEFTLNFLPQAKLSIRTGVGFPNKKDYYNSIGLGVEYYWLRADVATKIPFETYRSGNTDGLQLAFMFTAVFK